MEVTSIDLSCIQNNHLGVKKSTACSQGSSVPTQSIFKIFIMSCHFGQGSLGHLGLVVTMRPRCAGTGEGMRGFLLVYCFPLLCLQLFGVLQWFPTAGPAIIPIVLLCASLSWGDLATRQLSQSLSHE